MRLNQRTTNKKQKNDMKTLKKIITLAVLTFALSTVTAQSPPPPNGDTDPTSDGSTRVGDDGSSAPIGGGVAMLVAMGAAYGGKKYYDYRRKLKNEMED